MTPAAQIQEIVMTHKSIKLLALAIICGCSILGTAVAVREAIMLLMFAVAVITGLGFMLYWYLLDESRK
jgi:hypothetical protein